MHDALELAQRAADDAMVTVLITGETGTGKKLLARCIHEAGAHAPEPFVAIDCASLPAPLVESELFGRTARPSLRTSAKHGLFEIAGHGTIFLDSVNALPMALVPQVLRVLSRRTFVPLGGREGCPLNARMIAAAPSASQSGLFSPQHLRRFRVMHIELPSLRDRGNDIETLARHFIAAHGQERATTLQLSAEAVRALKEHAWPGNVRELKSVIDRAVVVCTNGTIRRRDLMFRRRRVVADAGEVASVIQIPADGKSLDAITHEAIRVTLVLTQGNLSAAARILGISRPTLSRKMREMGVV